MSTSEKGACRRIPDNAASSVGSSWGPSPETGLVASLELDGDVQSGPEVGVGGTGLVEEVDGAAPLKLHRQAELVELPGQILRRKWIRICRRALSIHLPDPASRRRPGASSRLRRDGPASPQLVLHQDLRGPQVGLFGLFCQQVNHRVLCRFGRKPDGSPSPPWAGTTWTDQTPT